MNISNLCKTCRHVDQIEVVHGHRVVGTKPICDYMMPAFPSAKSCQGHEPHDHYDEARHARNPE